MTGISLNARLNDAVFSLCGITEASRRIRISPNEVVAEAKRTFGRPKVSEHFVRNGDSILEQFRAATPALKDPQVKGVIVEILDIVHEVDSDFAEDLRVLLPAG